MKKVLLIEDDPFIRDITSIKLTEHSYSVVIAHNGESVIDQMKNDTPDVVILDLDLPDISGLEVMKLIKADVKLKEIPIIIFSNNDNPSVKEKAEELGIAGFFIKAATSFDDLLAYINKVVGK